MQRTLRNQDERNECFERDRNERGILMYLVKELRESILQLGEILSVASHI